MSLNDAINVIRKNKDKPVIKNDEKSQYDMAVKEIIDAVENGYDLYDSNKVFRKLEEYQEERIKNNTAFDLGIAKGYDYATAIIKNETNKRCVVEDTLI